MHVGQKWNCPFGTQGVSLQAQEGYLESQSNLVFKSEQPRFSRAERGANQAYKSLWYYRLHFIPWVCPHLFHLFSISTTAIWFYELAANFFSTTHFIWSTVMEKKAKNTMSLKARTGCVWTDHTEQRRHSWAVFHSFCNPLGSKKFFS